MDIFPNEFRVFEGGKPIPCSSRLLTLSPELDETREFIWVGGHLCRSEGLAYTSLLPLVLDPFHPVTHLLIQDRYLRHPRPDCVFTQIQRSYWIPQSREAVQFPKNLYRMSKMEKRAVPKMSDLPVACLCLYKPVFCSTSIDCFGPFEVKMGRRS